MSTHTPVGGLRRKYSDAGVYEGLVDHEGNSVAVSLSDDGTALVSGDGIAIGLAQTTLAGLAAQTGRYGVAYQVTDLAGAPVFLWDGTRWMQQRTASLYDTAIPYIPLDAATSEVCLPPGYGLPDDGVTLGQIYGREMTAAGAFAVTAANLGLGSIPASATGLEVWSTSGDSFGWSPVSGSLVVDGSSRATNNNFLVAGIGASGRPHRMILPFGNGIDITTYRFCPVLEGAGKYFNARLISRPLKYIPAALTTTDTVSTSGIQFLNFGTSSSYPADTDAVLLQINGANNRTTWSSDALAPLSTRGRHIGIGEVRLYDMSEYGIALSGLRFQVPASHFVKGMALQRAF